jgi:predicted dehydrogenase
MTVRIGIIGCGEHSEIGHAVPLARYASTYPGAITLVAACDLRRERAELFCQKYGFGRTYLDMNEMLAEEKLDVCISVAPVELISRIGITLLQAKIPCVVEKPLGSSIIEVQKLRDLARAVDAPNMVSVNRRFMPLLNRGVEWAKKAGSLQYIRATMLRHARTEPDFLPFTGIHALDTVRFVAGNFESLSIQSLTRTSPRWYTIAIQFESGPLCRLDVLPTTGMQEETYELMGDGFRCVITSPFGPQRLLRCYQRDQLVLEEIAGKDIPEDVTFGFYGEAVELIEALTHGRRPHPSIEDVFPSVKTCFELAERVEADSAESLA